MNYSRRADIDLKQISARLQVAVRMPAQEKTSRPLSGAWNVKRTVLIAAILSGALASPAALAGEDDCKVPMAQWQPREAVEQMAKAQGWTVQRLKIDDGCYQIRGRDGSGREFEAKVDPGSLAVVRMKNRNGRREEDDGRRGPSRAIRPLPPTNPSWEQHLPRRKFSNERFARHRSLRTLQPDGDLKRSPVTLQQCVRLRLQCRPAQHEPLEIRRCD